MILYHKDKDKLLPLELRMVSCVNVVACDELSWGWGWDNGARTCRGWDNGVGTWTLLVWHNEEEILAWGVVWDNGPLHDAFDEETFEGGS
jgi:hypothetical protein